MPSITVTRKFHTFTISVNPSTLVSEITAQAVQHFKLSGKPTTAYALTIPGKQTPLDGSLSVRFANLPQGAHLELLGPLTGNNATDKKVKIRITVVDTLSGETNTVTSEYDSNADVSKLLTVLKESDLVDRTVQLQLMTRVLDLDNVSVGAGAGAGVDVDVDVDVGVSLSELGLCEGSHAVRVVIGKKRGDDKKGKVEDWGNSKGLVNWGKNVLKKKSEKKNEGLQTGRKENLVSKGDHVLGSERNAKVESKLVSVPVSEHKLGHEPEQESKADIVMSDQDVEVEVEPVLTIEQARKYQQMLSHRAADEPLLTRSLRAKFANEEAEAKEAKLEKLSKLSPYVEIKIVFPDSKAVMLKIDKGQTLEELVRVLENEVLNPEVKKKCEVVLNRLEHEFFYIVSTGHPNKTVVLGNDMKKEWRRCELQSKTLAPLLGNRVILYFSLENAYKGHVNGDNLVRETKKADSMPLTTSDIAFSESASSAPKTSSPLSKKSKTFSKLPKWVQLGKK